MIGQSKLLAAKWRGRQFHSVYILGRRITFVVLFWRIKNLGVFTNLRISNKTQSVKMMATVAAQRMPFGDISNKENASGGLALKKKAAAQEKELENGVQKVTQLFHMLAMV